jgi:hypothetical protein
MVAQPFAHRGAPAPYGFGFFTVRHLLWIAISLPSQSQNQASIAYNDM